MIIIHLTPPVIHSLIFYTTYFAWLSSIYFNLNLILQNQLSLVLPTSIYHWFQIYFRRNLFLFLAFAILIFTDWTIFRSPSCRFLLCFSHHWGSQLPSAFSPWIFKCKFKGLEVAWRVFSYQFRWIKRCLFYLCHSY